MIRDVIVYPDKRLRLISKEVEVFNTNLHNVLDDMYDTMLSKNGIGLSAIQIGIDIRVLIISIPENEDKINMFLTRKENTIEMINPTIVESEGTQKYQEGCLSVPGFYEDIERSNYVKVEYFDRFGNKKVIEDEGLLSVVIQHEIDHLNGKVFVEKLSILRRKKFEKEWKKLHKI